MNLPYWVLLFFLYSVMFVGSFIFQLGLVFFILMLKNKIKKIIYWSFLLVIVFLIVLLLDVHHGYFFIKQFFLYAQSYNDGWGLEWISPFSMLGLPGNIVTHAAPSIIISMVFFLGLLLIIGFRIYIKRNLSTQLAFFLLATTIFLAYDVLFCYFGATQYRPWKFASCYALPLGGALCAAFLVVLSLKKMYEKWIVVIILLTVIYNGAFAWFHEQPFQTFSSKYKELAILNQQSFNKLWIKMDSYAATFLAPYFIQNKELYLLSDSYYPKYSLNNQKINSTGPLFIETHQLCDRAIKKVGCLYLTLRTKNK